MFCRSRGVAPVVALALALTAPAGPVTARSLLEPPELERYLRWGPVRVRPGFEIANLGYDDNLFFNSEEKIGDYTVTLAPQVEGIMLLGSRAFLTFRERLEYTAYKTESDLNFLNVRGNARVTVPFGRWGIFGEGTANRVKERPSDRLDIRPERNERLAGFGVILEPGWRSSIELFRSDGRWRYSDADDATSGGQSIASRVDRNETLQSLVATYRLRGRTSLTLDLRQREFAFTNAELRRDTDSLSVLPGLRLEEGGPLIGSLKLGRSSIDPQDPARRSFSEPIGEAELAWRSGSGTTLRLDARRQAGISLYESELVYVESDYALRAIHYWNRLFGSEIGGSIGRLTFPEGTTNRQDDTRHYDAGVRVRIAETSLGRRIEYSLRIGRYSRDSTVDSLDQSQTTVSLNAILGY